jgi:hypothetical protein
VRHAIPVMPPMHVYLLGVHGTLDVSHGKRIRLGMRLVTAMGRVNPWQPCVRQWRRAELSIMSVKSQALVPDARG